MTELELISKLNNTTTGSQKLDEYDAYIVKLDGMIGVAVPITKDLFINERFNKIYIKNFLFEIDRVATKVIFLYTKEVEMSEKYASICLNFISLSCRDKITNNPIEWYTEWINLLGNSKRNKMIYDFIGEMTVLNELQKRGETPTWDSINKGTFDITTNNSIYEVKASIVKSFDAITIHNQFQLDIEGINKPLFIAYVKLEENEAGVSIDSLANQLVNGGFSKNILEDYLRNNGYYSGKIERYKKYIIHEVRLYKVDKNFPFITKNSFVNNKMPNNVVKLEYTLSLDGLDYSVF